MNDRKNLMIATLQQSIQQSSDEKKVWEDQLAQTRKELEYLHEMQAIFQNKHNINDAVVAHKGLIISQNNVNTPVHFDIPVVQKAFSKNGELFGSNDGSSKYYFDISNKDLYVAMPTYKRISHDSMKSFNGDNNKSSTAERLIIDAVRMVALNTLQERDVSYFNADINDSEELMELKQGRKSQTMNAAFEELRFDSLKNPILKNNDITQLAISTEFQKHFTKAITEYENEIKKIETRIDQADNKIKKSRHTISQLESSELKEKLIQHFKHVKVTSFEKDLIKKLFTAIDKIQNDVNEGLKLNAMKIEIIDSYAQALHHHKVNNENKGMTMFQHTLSEELHSFLHKTFHLQPNEIDALVKQRDKEVHSVAISATNNNK